MNQEIFIDVGLIVGTTLRKKGRAFFRLRVRGFANNKSAKPQAAALCSLAILIPLFFGCVLDLTHAAEPNRAEVIPLTPDLRQRCLNTLRQAIKSTEFWPGIHAAESLTLAGSGDEVILAFHDRLASEKDDQRRVGLCRELVRAGDRSFLPVLFTILGDTHSSGRAHAAESLYKLGEVGDRKLLIAATEQTDDRPLHDYATAALARSGDARASARLRELLQSDDRKTRNIAAYALARVGTESDVKPLLAALERETDPDARGMLVNTLAVLGNARGRNEMARNLDSPDPVVRALAAEFVGHSRSIEYQAKLVKLLDDSALDVRVRAGESLIALSQSAGKR